jgi:ketosteroid isomerase-like protein
MLHDYAQTVRSFYDAFARGDTQRFTELLDPKIEWTAAETFLYADHSPYVGIDAVLKLIFERLPADWADFSVSAEEVLGGGDLVIASGRFRGRFKANGASIDAQFVQVIQCKDGKIAKCQMYTDTAQFKDPLGECVNLSAVLECVRTTRNCAGKRNFLGARGRARNGPPFLPNADTLGRLTLKVVLQSQPDVISVFAVCETMTHFSELDCIADPHLHNRAR